MQSIKNSNPQPRLFEMFFLFFYICISFNLFGVTWLAGKNNGAASDDLTGLEMSVSNCEYSAVFSSLPQVINWLRDRVQQNQSTRFQVKLINS
jgi:hypothetical protein